MFGRGAGLLWSVALQTVLTSWPCAADSRKPCQGRKAAALSGVIWVPQVKPGQSCKQCGRVTKLFRCRMHDYYILGKIFSYNIRSNQLDFYFLMMYNTYQFTWLK